METKVSFLLMSLIAVTECAKILYVMPFTAKSHFIAQKDLPLELARRGHELFVITPHSEPSAPPNYHELKVPLKYIWDTLFDERPSVFVTINNTFIQQIELMHLTGYMVSELVMNSTEVQRFLQEDHQIDLVINELFFQESLYMFAHKYKAPQVLVTTFGNSFKANYYLRNPLQLSTLYHEYASSSDPLSFMGRLMNLYYCMADLIYFKLYYLPKQEEYARRIFKDLPEPLPSLEDLTANVSLVLMNNHFSIDVPGAYLPNMVEVGGLNHNHKETNNTLPQDLQSILDDAKKGVVYLNFGSNVATSDLSEDKLDALLTVFGELEQTVLMKWENDGLPKAPKNLIVKKWFPQKEILAHPNVKVFIGHGGLIGLMEAVSAGVPIIGVPVYGDQFLNLLLAKEKGFGEILNHHDITKDNVRSVLNKVLKDKSYSEQVKLYKLRFNDRPMNGLDTAVWWIEYIIRHKGADFIRTPALNMNFISYHNIDVFSFLLATILTFVITFMKIFSLVKKLCKTTAKGKDKRKYKKE